MSRYEGELMTVWKTDGRLMELNDRFAFIDKDGTIWDVPAGAQIDGASIPRLLWTITGSPYTGKYRDASVVHDWYCSIRTRKSDATHLMFFEAMLVSGVTTARARVMYAAVRYAGPKWSDMDIHNTNLATNDRWGRGSHRLNYWGPGGMPPFDTPEYAEYESRIMQETRERNQEVVEARARANASVAQFERIAEEVISRSLDTDDIDQLVSSVAVSETLVLETGLHPFTDETFPPVC